MKRIIIETISFKRLQLSEVNKLQEIEKDKSKLDDLDKNESELKAHFIRIKKI